MKKSYLNYLAVLFLALMVIACGGKEGTDGVSDGENEKEIVEDKPSVPEEPNAVCLWPEPVSIREEANSKSKFITSMSLGEKVFYLGDEQTVQEGGRDRTYCKIKLQDGKEGWTRTDFVGVDAKVVAILDEITVYKRPDLLAKSNDKFDRMDVVAVFEEKDDFVRVKGKKGTWYKEGWIKKDNITEEQTDVIFAIYYSKAQMISDDVKKQKELQALVDNGDLGSSIFVSELREKLVAKEMEEEIMPDEEDAEGSDGGGVDEE